MKFAISLWAMGLVAITAHAQGGGFSGPDSRRIVLASEASTMADDTSVRLQGYVVEVVGSDEYIFRDDSGTIVVEIDADEWNGIDVTPNLRVELSGEIDRKRGRVEVDVDAVHLAD